MQDRTETLNVRVGADTALQQVNIEHEHCTSIPRKGQCQWTGADTALQQQQR